MKKIFNCSVAICCVSIALFLPTSDAVVLKFHLKSDASNELKNVGGAPEGITPRLSMYETKHAGVKFGDGGQLVIDVRPQDQLFLYKTGMLTWTPALGTAEELIKKYGADITITHITRTGTGAAKRTSVTMEATQK